MASEDTVGMNEAQSMDADQSAKVADTENRVGVVRFSGELLAEVLFGDNTVQILEVKTNSIDSVYFGQPVIEFYIRHESLQKAEQGKMIPRYVMVGSKTEDGNVELELKEVK